MSDAEGLIGTGAAGAAAGLVAAAAAREAEADAARVAALLRRAGITPETDGAGRVVRPVTVDPGFLLELSAVARLRAWEESGVRGRLPADLPTAAAAMDELLSHFDGGDIAAVAARLRGGPLKRRVLSVWLAHFAWDGPGMAGGDVVVSAGVPDGDALDRLARFLWQRRQRAGKGEPST